MPYSARFLIAVLLVAGVVAAAPASAAKMRPPLPTARFIAPAGTIRDAEDLDAIYRRTVELFLARHPECERLRAYRRLTPGGSTVIVTIRCMAIRRFLTREHGTEAERSASLFLPTSPMPELTEVEITRQQLLPAVRGRRVLDFWCDWPRGLKGASPSAMRRDIAGRTIQNITRHGKALFFKLSGKPTRAMAIHLRMSGRLVIVKASKGARARDGRWMHFRWRLSPRRGSGQAGGRGLEFVDPRKFGVVWYGSPASLAGDSYLGTLGPDAAGISPEVLRTALGKRRGMVKAILLRQNVVAGIGNIIADESLWRAGIHPRAPIERLTEDDLGRLHRALAKTLQAIRRAGGTTLRDWGAPSGRRGRYQDSRVCYGRAGEPCPRCSTLFLRLVVGGRGTTYCPKCQRDPARVFVPQERLA